MKTFEKIIVLDFGSQYAHLIAKRFRALGYYTEIADPASELSVFENAKGIVMSGGPASVYEKNIPAFNEAILKLPIPILGLCYGHQLLTKCYGGKVEKVSVGEFGIAHLEKKIASPLFENVNFPMQVWMSHQDAATELPNGFEKIASTNDCEFAGIQNISAKRFGLQFHAEVKDTIQGNILFENFSHICGMQKNWNENEVRENLIKQIQEDARDKKVLLFLSGGVDSTVAFALLNKALGKKRVLGLHIDNGFMRKNESANVASLYRACGFDNFLVRDASENFLRAVENISDPQKKRMAIGEQFIKERDDFAREQNLKEGEWLLAQGTLYPDIIESGGTKNAHTIKTHHNRVEGIQALIEKNLIIEPLKDLYKDEVRALGSSLGLPRELIMRHPFPGPGLSINVLCTNGKLSESDNCDFEKANVEARRADFSLLEKPCTAECLPVKSVGVQGDFRTYRFPCLVRFQKNEAGFFSFPHDWEKIETVSSHLANTSSFINRMLLALYEKENLHLKKAFCTKANLDMLREVDAIALDILHKSNWYEKIFQHLTIMLPFATGDAHASFVLRPLSSEDVMTARFSHLDFALLDELVKKIASLSFVDALYFDATNKPPATFGWE